MNVFTLKANLLVNIHVYVPPSRNEACGTLCRENNTIAAKPSHTCEGPVYEKVITDRIVENIPQSPNQAYGTTRYVPKE